MNTFLFTIIISVSTISFLSCQQNDPQNHFQHEKLVKIWETSRDLKTPESVYYDGIRDVIYVANINGKPTDKDDNGFISQLSTEGKILNLKWIEGLHAPKGMGVYAGKLYVTDIDHVIEIDISKGEITNRYPAEGSEFLNDIAVDNQGNVYISDMATNKIHRLQNGILEVWLESDLFQSPNGLYVENDYLLIGIKDSLLKAALSDKSLSSYIKDTGGIDGIVPDGDGNYLISDWQGNVHLIHPEKKKFKLLDTTPLNINAADIDFIIKKRLLLVPTFFDNRIMAYQLK